MHGGSEELLTNKVNALLYLLSYVYIIKLK